MTAAFKIDMSDDKWTQWCSVLVYCRVCLFPAIVVGDAQEQRSLSVFVSECNVKLLNVISSAS